MNNTIELAWVIPLLPLIGFLINGLLRRQLPKPLIAIIGCGVILFSFVISVLIFMQVKNLGALGAQESFTGSTVLKLFDFISFCKV